MIIFGRGGKLQNSKKKVGKIEKSSKNKGWAHSILKLGLRAILRGLWATRRISEALQALSMALWASRCQKMMTFGSEPKNFENFEKLKKPPERCSGPRFR